MTSQTSSIRTAVLLLASAVLGLSATVSQAATLPGDAKSVSVDYSDLNLSSKQDSRVLYERIVSAAHQVCPSSMGPSARQFSVGSQCIAAAVNRAWSDVKARQHSEVRTASAR